MGMFIGSCIIVGYTYNELEEIFQDKEEEEFEEALDEFDRAFPYYDADRKHCIFGTYIVGANWTANEIDWVACGVNVGSVIYNLNNKYKKAPKVYISANVT